MFSCTHLEMIMERFCEIAFFNIHFFSYTVLFKALYIRGILLDFIQKIIEKKNISERLFDFLIVSGVKLTTFNHYDGIFFFFIQQTYMWFSGNYTYSKIKC